MTDKFLRFTVTHLAKGWEFLLIRLGLSDATIQKIKMDNPLDTDLQIFKALIRWRKENIGIREKVLYRNLKTALTEEEKGDIADALAGYTENSCQGDGFSPTRTFAHYERI